MSRYAGCKARHAVPSIAGASKIIDLFCGGGGASAAFIAKNGELSVVAGESSPGLRHLLKMSSIDLDASSFLDLIDRKGLEMTWNLYRDRLQEGDPMAWMALHECSYGNSMRTGKGRHNVKPALTKIDALRKRGKFISPIAYRPSKTLPTWQDALLDGYDPEAVVLSDPPYLDAGKIYNNDDNSPVVLGIPPLEEAMNGRVKAIVHWNYHSYEYEFMLTRAARVRGYSIAGQATGWQPKFAKKNETLDRPKEFIWVMRRD